MSQASDYSEGVELDSRFCAALLGDRTQCPLAHDPTDAVAALVARSRLCPYHARKLTGLHVVNVTKRGKKGGKVRVDQSLRSFTRRTAGQTIAIIDRSAAAAVAALSARGDQFRPENAAGASDAAPLGLSGKHAATSLSDVRIANATLRRLDDGKASLALVALLPVQPGGEIVLDKAAIAGDEVTMAS